MMYFIKIMEATRKSIIQAVITLSIIVIILIAIFALDISTPKRIMGFLLYFLVLITNLIITYCQKRKKE